MAKTDLDLGVDHRASSALRHPNLGFLGRLATLVRRIEPTAVTDRTPFKHCWWCGPVGGLAFMVILAVGVEYFHLR